MSIKRWISLAVVLTGLVLLLVLVVRASPPGQGPGPQGGVLAQGSLGTGFTYQGQLESGGQSVSESCDMAFRLYDQESGGSQVSSAISTTMPVSDGLFTVDLDFGGSAFDGDARWLEITVRCPAGSGSYTTLGRQALTATPYALYAMKAGGYGNVVVVAESGGDYTTVQAAIDSITDAAADNPYLVWVAPGVYSEMVTLKPYVHLQGAGQEATVITSTASSSGAWPPAQATLVLTSNSSLRDLTVGNGGAGESNTALLAITGTLHTLVADVTARALGGGTNNYAIFVSGSGTGVTLQQVTALAENGSNLNSGLINHGGAAVVLRGGVFTSRGGVDSWGIFSIGITTTLEAENVTVLAENGSNRNFGLYNWGGPTAVLYGGSFTGRGGSTPRGIENADSGAKLTAESVTALGENGSTDNFGFGSYDGVTTTLRGGAFTGRGGTAAYGVSNGANGAMLHAESVTALAESGSATNYGMSNFAGGVTVLHGGTFSGRGGTTAYGIHNEDSGTMLEAAGITALGDTNGLYQGDGTVSLGVTQLDGGAYKAPAATLTCFQVYSGTFALIDCTGL